MSRRRFLLVLALLLVAGLVVRIAYVTAQPSHDPGFHQPRLDGGYYLDWARALVQGEEGPAGAYYLAPLYAFLLAGFLRLFGENFTLLYLLQQTLIVAASGSLALAGRRLFGPEAGIAAAALALLYHPFLFFGSRPVGEGVAIFLLALALHVLPIRGIRGSAGAGLLCGTAALARPNLLLVGTFWAAGEAAGRQWRRAGLLVAAMALVVLPVSVRNFVASGHAVPISSNMGITFCHGNGPGARGIHTRPAGFSGSLKDQRKEATVLAGARAGRKLDPVEADRWWGWFALGVRLQEPAETAMLLARRLLLLVSDTEFSLGYAPGLDANPWRRAAPIPFAVILALGAASLIFGGARRAGGWPVWGAVLACSLMPWVFYVSSRYRLPAVAMLCLPAGQAAARLLSRKETGMERMGMAGVAVAVAAVSLLVPTSPLAAAAEASALSNRAVAWLRSGDLRAAEGDLNDALARDPDSVPAWFNRGVVMESGSREEEAERSYRRALAVDPAHAESAGNLAGILIRKGRFAEAASILGKALAVRPYHAVCWTNLVVALAAQGDGERARAAATEAGRLGVTLRPELLAEIGIVPGNGAATEGSPR